MIKNMVVFNPIEFLEDLEKEAKQAKKRLWVQVMFAGTGYVGKRLIEMFEDATKRGLDTKFNMDWYGFLVCTKDEKKEREKMFVLMQELGVEVTFTNPPTIFEKLWPYA